MRILITNDDGINAPGLVALTEIATDLVGTKGRGLDGCACLRAIRRGALHFIYQTNDDR